jgi:hypothetical protein
MFAVLLQQPLNVGAVIRGIYALQDRPLSGLVLKLTHGFNDQVVFLRPCLVQNQLGENYSHSS